MTITKDTEYAAFRITPKQKRFIKEQADENMISMSAYVRKLIEIEMQRLYLNNYETANTKQH